MLVIRLIPSGGFHAANGERDVAFAYGAMYRRINPSWGGPIELFRERDVALW